MLDPNGVWIEGAAGTNLGATATHAAAANRTHFVTELSGHTDLDSLVQILDGTTVVWESYVDVSAGRAFSFSVHVPITAGTACSGKIDASTADCYVNLGGYTVP